MERMKKRADDDEEEEEEEEALQAQMQRFKKQKKTTTTRSRNASRSRSNDAMVMMSLQMKKMWKRFTKAASSITKKTSYCFCCCFVCTSSSSSSSSLHHHPHPHHRRTFLLIASSHRHNYDRLNQPSSSSSSSVVAIAAPPPPPPPPSIHFLKPPSSPSSHPSDFVFPLFFDSAFLERPPNLPPQHHHPRPFDADDDLLLSFRSDSTSASSAFPATRRWMSPPCDVDDGDDDTVLLKIGILGDSETGKTSFMAKYVAAKQGQEYVETIGVASVEKLIRLRNVNIALSIWDLGAHWQCSSMLPMVCADAAAIFIMFDLTRRSTLQSVKDWYLQARRWNKAAIPVIIGTKYDQFVELPNDIQFAIIQQARFYAKAMEAALFFSSVTHNINVHKIFKVIVAKLFDLPCTISRNLNFGEPIIDY